MATAHDVAAHILKSCGSLTAMKLQKLVYYSQAWHLVWDDELLFDETVEAWANGPVVRELYDEHRGQYTVTAWSKGDGSNLTESERATVDSVTSFYGSKSAFWLSELTHKEAPWKDAREGIPKGVRSSQEITPAAMAEFYGSLV